MFYCPRCGQATAIWQSDFNNEDYGYEDEGITSVYFCGTCTSEITVTTFEELESNNSLISSDS